MARDTTELGYEFTDIVKGSATKTIERFESQELWSLPDKETPTKEIKAPADKTPLDLSSTLAFQGHPEYLPPYSDKPITSKPIFSAKMATQQVMSLATQTAQAVTETVNDQVSAMTSSEGATDGADLFEIDFDAFLPMEGSEIPVDWYIDVEVERYVKIEPLTR